MRRGINLFYLHTRWEAKRYVTPVMIISLVYNFPRFFELNVVEIVDGMNQLITTYTNYIDILLIL